MTRYTVMHAYTAHKSPRVKKETRTGGQAVQCSLQELPSRLHSHCHVCESHTSSHG